MKLLNIISNAIFNLIDPHEYIRKEATDRNMILYGYDRVWMILDVTGNVLAIDDTPVKAFCKAIFKN
jgi:hypothetical protein